MTQASRKQIFYLLLLAFVQLPLIAQDSKFQPPEGKTLLIIGQDLGAIGGFSSPNNDGYVDHFDQIPAGFTTYTSLSSLQGLGSLTNYGAGDICAQDILDNSKFDQTVLSIGLYLVGQLDDINSGELDDNIDQFSTWVKSTNIPIYLRIGYEFNLSYNNYDPTAYKAAFIHIVDKMRNNGVDNVAYVWQSEGSGTKNELLAWYPGDGYVDWLGYSHFQNQGEGIIDLAREKSKPVMIAEATPQGYVLTEVEGNVVWDAWFAPLLDHIEENSDVIQALCYINVNWDAQSMWQGQNWGDSRIQVNSIVETNWLSALTESYWLFQSDSLYSQIQFTPITSLNQTIHKEELVNAFIRDGCCFFSLNTGFQGQILIQLYDLSGKLCYGNREYKPSQKELFSFQVENLKQGAYILSVREGSCIHSPKLITRAG